MNLLGEIEAFKGFHALPYVLAGILRNVVVPND
jgi:hypothetical protein